MAKLHTDPFSQLPIFIELKFDDHVLGCATAFLHKRAEKTYLISNWHNFSGRDPQSKKPIRDDAGLPNTVSCYLCRDQAFIDRKWHDFKLCDSNSVFWLEHPDHHNLVDVAALPIELPSEFRAITVDDMPLTELRAEVSQDIFVLGYPLGLTDTHGMPLWKRASIASEPGTSSPSFLVDTATRKGMSGSPVIHRFRGFYRQDPKGGSVSPEDWFGEGSNFVGVYSGRLGESEFKAQLGIVWKRHLIPEIIDGNYCYDPFEC